MKYLILTLLLTACGQPSNKPEIKFDDTLTATAGSPQSKTWQEIDTLIRCDTPIRIASMLEGDYYKIYWIKGGVDKPDLLYAALRNDTLTIAPSVFDSLFKKAKIVRVGGVVFRKQSK
jgi:hypothetical protein